MWICPECGRKFSRNRQSHSCEQYDPELQFIGKSQKARDLYNLVIEKVQAFGEIEINPQKWNITIRRLKTFMAIMVEKDHLTVVLISDRQVDDFPIHQSYHHSAQRWSNALKIESPDEIDDQLLQWLKEAFDLAI